MLGVHVQYNITPTLGFRTEYMYQRMSGPDKTISIVDNPGAAAVTNGLIESNHQFHAVTFNAVARRKSEDRPIGGYGLARLAATMFDQVQLPGALPLAGAAVVLIGAAAVASFTPAARASRVDVLQALRSE